MHTTANSDRQLRNQGFIAALGIVSAVLLVRPAFANEGPGSGDKNAEGDAKNAKASDANGGDAKSGDAKAGDEKAVDTKNEDGKGGELKEDPLKRYCFLGVRFRDIVAPQFMMELFASGGGTATCGLSGFFFGLAAGYGF